MLSRIELSGDRTKATLFYLEPLPGSANIVAIFDRCVCRAPLSLRLCSGKVLADLTIELGGSLLGADCLHRARADVLMIPRVSGISQKIARRSRQA